MIALQVLNLLDQRQFVAALDGIFEHSAWIAERTWRARPFTSRVALLEALRGTIISASADEQLALIQAHPELAGKAAVRGELTAESTREQTGAGLQRCTREEFDRLHTLNAAYRARFQFPFILAVRGHTPQSIITQLAKRLDNDAASEKQTALLEIGRIAAFRLAERIVTPLGPEIMAMLVQLAAFSECHDNLTCSYLSPAHRAAAVQIQDWMLSAGLEVEIDAVGNVVGRMACGSPNARSLLVGSHYDTVANAGRFDGRLGIALPIACILDLRRRGVQLPFDLEIIAFADEEGARFGSTFIGSSAVAGCFDFGILEKKDRDGISMRAAMQAAGLDPTRIPTVARDPPTLLGYIEVHIEQGPVLATKQQPLGVVTAIAGATRYQLSIRGRKGHAGTVPMALRRDALAAAAEIVLAIERRCAGTSELVGTVGQLHIPDAAINVIPGTCDFTMDVRASTDRCRSNALSDLFNAFEEIAQRRGVSMEHRKLMEADVVSCARPMQRRWAESIARVTGEPNPVYLPSGAGHDAMRMATVTDVGMLFVRCGCDGISHDPCETVAMEDIQQAARVFEDFILHFETTT